MRKCRNCICRTCINVCCSIYECPGKKKECSRYNEIEQTNVFSRSPEIKRKSAPRKPWEEYGLGDREYRKRLKDMAQHPEYAKIVRNCAHIAAQDIEEYIYLSVAKNLKFEAIEYDSGLGRIPCGRTDFYGYRRYFYHLFNEKIKEMGK